MQPFITLRRPWARREVLNDEEEEGSISRYESVLLTLGVSATRNHEGFFDIVQNPFSNIVFALLVSPKDFLEKNSSVVVFRICTLWHQKVSRNAARRSGSGQLASSSGLAYTGSRKEMRLSVILE